MDDDKAMWFTKRPLTVSARRVSEVTHIDTLEGRMKANPGDWIITGVKGEEYPCRDDIFRATYEALDPQTLALQRELEGQIQALQDERTSLLNGPNSAILDSYREVMAVQHESQKKLLELLERMTAVAEAQCP